MSSRDFTISTRGFTRRLLSAMIQEASTRETSRTGLMNTTLLSRVRRSHKIRLRSKVTSSKPVNDFTDNEQITVPDNVRIAQSTTDRSTFNDDTSTQQAIRRSPGQSASGVAPNFNEIPTQRTRIPSTWITSSTSTTTTVRPKSSRPPLRTSAATVRTPVRAAPASYRPVRLYYLV